MTGKTHIAAGAFASAILLHPRHPVPFAAITALAAAGAICPDIDHTESKPHKAVSRFLLFAAVLVFAFLIGQNSFGIKVPWEMLTFGLSQSQMTGLAGFLLLGVFGYGQPHRGFTHSVTALLAFSYALWSVRPCLGAAFGTGYAVHILLDCLNRKGLQILWPSGKRWSLGACPSNGNLDRALFVLCVSGYILYGVSAIGEELVRNISSLAG